MIGAQSARADAGREFDHIVVGAGIVGLAAAYQLSRRGRTVAVFEQFALGHGLGSSHGNSRIFRLAYDTAVYVRLAQRSRSWWQRIEAEAGAELLRPGGVMDIGDDSSLLPIAHALGSASATTFRGPDIAGSHQFALPPGFGLLYQPDGGTSWAARSSKVFIELASRDGAEIKATTPVESIALEGDSVSVAAGGLAYSAGSVVVAAAGWSNKLLARLGLSLPLRVTREHVAYYVNRSGIDFLPFIWHPGDGMPETYGLPNLADETVKVGRHIAGHLVEPGSEGIVQPEEIQLINDFVRRHLPLLDPVPVRAETCLYASSPDDDFILDRVGSIVIGAGFGGHGFKFAPVVGEILADLAEGKPVEMDPRFSLARFGAVHA